MSDYIRPQPNPLVADFAGVYFCVGANLARGLMKVNHEKRGYHAKTTQASSALHDLPVGLSPCLALDEK